MPDTKWIISLISRLTTASSHLDTHVRHSVNLEHSSPGPGALYLRSPSRGCADSTFLQCKKSDITGFLKAAGLEEGFDDPQPRPVPEHACSCAAGWAPRTPFGTSPSPPAAAAFPSPSTALAHLPLIEKRKTSRDAFCSRAQRRNYVMTTEF